MFRDLISPLSEQIYRDCGFCVLTKEVEELCHCWRGILRMVPTIVIVHTFCASPDTQISYRQCLLIQGYFCAV